MFGFLMSFVYLTFVLFGFGVISAVFYFIVPTAIKASLITYIIGKPLESNYRYPDDTLTHRNYVPEYLWTIAFSMIAVVAFFVQPLSGSLTTLAILILLTLLSFRTVPEQGRYVIELFGQYFATWGPGLHVLPIGFTIRSMVTIADQKLDLLLDGKEHEYTEINGKHFQVAPSQLDFVDDSAGVFITTIFRVTNPWKNTYGVNDFIQTFIDRVEGHTRSVLGLLRLDDALQIRDGAAKLIRSLFIREKKEGEHEDLVRARSLWHAVRRNGVYGGESDVWIPEGPDSPLHFVEEVKVGNMFLIAREADLPCGHPDCNFFSIEDWGIKFVPEGIVVKDFKLRSETLTLRDDLLAANRGVRIAERERQQDKLQGRGRRERLQEIRKGLGRGATGSDAAQYDIAEKVATKALPVADVTIVQSDLALAGLAKLAGSSSKPNGSRHNSSSDDEGTNS